MALTGFVCFSPPDDEMAPNWNVPVSELEGLSASRIIAKYADGELMGVTALGLRTPKRIIAITDERPVLTVCPELAFSTRRLKYERSQFALVKLSSASKVTLYCDVQAFDEENKPSPLMFPPLGVTFDRARVTNARELLGLLKDRLAVKTMEEEQVHGFWIENEPKFLMVDKREVGADYLIREVIDGDLSVTYACVLSQKTINRIKDHGRVFAEVLQTEETYVAKMGIMLKFWIPNIRKNKLLPGIDLKRFEDGIISMRRIHDTFMNRLAEAYRGYATCYGAVFMEMAPFFTVSKDCVLLTRTISLLLGKMKKEGSRKHAKLEALYTDMRSNMQSEHDKGRFGNTFETYVIETTQRVTRYPLLLATILKDTPLCHPDVIPLRCALEQVKDVVHRIEDVTDTDRNAQEMMSLQDTLTESYNIMDSPRHIIMSVPVKIEGHSDSGTTIYMFPDIICIMKKTNGKNIVLADALIEKFHGIDYGGTCLLVPAVSFLHPIRKTTHGYVQGCRELEIDFEDRDALMRFKTAWRNISETIIRITLTDVPYMKWTRLETKKLPFCLYKHTVVQMPKGDNTAMVFGGATLSTENNTESDNLHLLNVDLATYAVTSIAKLPQGHGIRKCTANMFDRLVFVSGGKCGNNLREKLGRYDSSSNAIADVLAYDNHKLKPRTGHTTVYYDQRLWTFGGMTAGVKTHVLRDVTVFWPGAPRFERMKPKYCPCRRYGHSATVIGSHMYVFGGHGTKGPLNDLWYFDMTSCTWTHIPLTGGTIVGRYDHFAMSLSGKLIVFGGITKAVADQCTMVINLESGHVTFLPNVGHVPVNLKGACCVRRDDSSFCVLGGRENMVKVSDCIYNVEIVGVERLECAQLRNRSNRFSVNYMSGNTTMQDALFAGLQVDPFSDDIETALERMDECLSLFATGEHGNVGSETAERLGDSHVPGHSCARFMGQLGEGSAVDEPVSTATGRQVVNHLQARPRTMANLPKGK